MLQKDPASEVKYHIMDLSSSGSRKAGKKLVSFHAMPLLLAVSAMESLHSWSYVMSDPASFGPEHTALNKLLIFSCPQLFL